MSNEDRLVSLPIDDSVKPDPEETAIVSQIFGAFSNIEKPAIVFNHFKPSVVGAVLFLLLSLPPVDKLLSSWIKSESPYFILIVKMIVFFVLFYLISNWSLSRNSKKD